MTVAAQAQGFTPTIRTVSPSVPTAGAPVPPGPFNVPGTPVGQFLSPVGERFPAVGQPGGTPIGYIGPGGMPVTTTPPPGSVVDMSKLSAPITGPLPPGMMPENKSLIQKLHEFWAKQLGLVAPQENLATNWTPGISRRNRARNKLPWIWD